MRPPPALDPDTEEEDAPLLGDVVPDVAEASDVELLLWPNLKPNLFLPALPFPFLLTLETDSAALPLPPSTVMSALPDPLRFLRRFMVAGFAPLGPVGELVRSMSHHFFTFHYHNHLLPPLLDALFWFSPSSPSWFTCVAFFFPSLPPLLQIQMFLSCDRD